VALHAAEDTGPVSKPAILVYGVPPENETGLLIGGEKTLTGKFATGGADVLVKPGKNAPT
jgi:hypothetical protein